MDWLGAADNWITMGYDDDMYYEYDYCVSCDVRLSDWSRNSYEQHCTNCRIFNDGYDLVRRQLTIPQHQLHDPEAGPDYLRMLYRAITKARRGQHATHIAHGDGERVRELIHDRMTSNWRLTLKGEELFLNGMAYAAREFMGPDPDGSLAEVDGAMLRAQQKLGIDLAA